LLGVRGCFLRIESIQANKALFLREECPDELETIVGVYSQVELRVGVEGLGGRVVAWLVEARYVKYTLQKAQLADQETASQLIADLLRDLGSLRALSDAGAQTLASIRCWRSALLVFDQFISASGTPQTKPPRFGATDRPSDFASLVPSI